MLIDLRQAILDALASPEGQQLIREAMAAAKPEPASEPVEDRLLGAAEAGRLLDMSQGAVRQAAWRGSLPKVYVGRRLRFRLSDIMQKKSTWKR